MFNYLLLLDKDCVDSNTNLVCSPELGAEDATMNEKPFPPH